ncbi:putative serine/threonine-protein kinase pats1 [Stylophora pistillata]|uniref:Putative serine/threonine-protein kinase pats1 n=1 Tax=Stylophora pistillata TaxID=50429 RepID=A0A2B4RNB1_STYPI|nr:putative serine/threonine-protein kinase pats1 [Stylophora pistillata]
MTKTKFVKKNAHNGGFLDVGNSHSIGEMHFKGLTKRLVNLRRIGAAKAVKSDFAKKKIKVSLEVFLRLLQKKYQLLTSSIDEVLSQLAEEDITSVCLLELGWEEIKHFFSPHVRGIIEQELKILSEEMEGFSSTDIPPHILARGPSALKAYKKAIAEGKTFVRRVPIMLIGQDRSGKTSLKRSLRGQIFDEDENSTVGVTVDPSYFKVSHDVWKVGEKDEGVNSGTTFSYEYQAARLTVENLNEEQEFMFPQNLEEDMLIKETLPIKKLSGFKESRAPSIPSSQRVPVKTERAEERIPDTHSVSSGSVLTPEISHDLSLDPADVPMKNWESSDLSQVKITGEKRGGDSIKDMPADVASIIEMLLQSEDITKCEEDVFSVLWDFGGQTVYHATHPLFLTSNAIFLLVSDLSRNPFEKVKSPKQGMFTELEDSHSLKTNMDYLDFWMSSVASLAIQDEGNPVVTQSDVLPEKLPPVFLVCTHADMPHDRRGPKVQAGMVFGHLQNKPYNVHLYDDVFVVDNTKSGHESECPEVVRLRKEVLAVAKKLPQAKQAVPIRWLKFEKAIQTTKEEGRKWIPLQSAKDIASDVCDIVDDDEFSALLNFLHDQRILIHFDDTPNLNKMVVLDVQWLIDVLKEVITVRPYDGKEKKFKDLWKKLEKEGVLEEDLLEHVWGSSYDDGETRESLVAIMEKFSLLCPLPSSDGSCSRTYLVPSMLMSHPPEDVLELVASAEAPPLFLRFESGQVPSGLFCRLVLQLFQWCKQEYASPEYPQLYLNFARFYNSEEGNCSVILLCRMSSIEVVVHRGSSSNWETHRSKSKTTSPLHNNDDTFACAVLRQLELMLESMRIEFWWLQNMKYAVQFLCPVCCPGGAVSYCRTHLSKGCKQDECLHFWSKSELCRNMKNICCTRSATAKSNSISLKYFEAWFRSKRNQQPTCSEDDDGSLASSDATQLCLTRERVGEDITPQMKEVLQLEGTCFGTPISDSKREQALATSNKTTEVFLPENVQQSLLIPSRDAKEVVFQLKENLQLDQDFLERPDLETTKLIRSLAQKAKEFKRLDVFKLLKEIAPAGTTGPLLPENLPVQNIPFAKARELTINLSGGDEWMGVVEGLGLTPQEIRFLDKRTLNPMAAALSFIVKRRHLSVDELYELLIEQGFPKMADLL